MKSSSDALKWHQLWSWERFSGGEKWQLKVINQTQLSFHVRQTIIHLAWLSHQPAWQLVMSYVNGKHIECWQFLQLLGWAISFCSLLKPDILSCWLEESLVNENVPGLITILKSLLEMMLLAHHVHNTPRLLCLLKHWIEDCNNLSPTNYSIRWSGQVWPLSIWNPANFNWDTL